MLEQGTDFLSLGRQFIHRAIKAFFLEISRRTVDFHGDYIFLLTAMFQEGRL